MQFSPKIEAMFLHAELVPAKEPTELLLVRMAAATIPAKLANSLIKQLCALHPLPSSLKHLKRIRKGATAVAKAPQAEGSAAATALAAMAQGLQGIPTSDRREIGSGGRKGEGRGTAGGGGGGDTLEVILCCLDAKAAPQQTRRHKGQDLPPGAGSEQSLDKDHYQDTEHEAPPSEV